MSPQATSTKAARFGKAQSYSSTWDLYSRHEQGNFPEKSHSHRSVSFHTARFIRTDLPEQACRVTHRLRKPQGSLCDRSEQVVGAKSRVPVALAGGELGGSLKPGGCCGGLHPVEWKSGRAPSVTWGAAQLECWVAGALSS